MPFTNCFILTNQNVLFSQTMLCGAPSYIEMASGLITPLEELLINVALALELLLERNIAIPTGGT